MLRRKVFHGPPTRRNVVWQTDFSEFETTGGGIWRICAVIDYATKYCLAVTVTSTARGADAPACLRLAVAEAERILDVDDLRAGRGLAEVIGPAGEVLGVAPAPIAVVSDNGPCFRGEVFKTAFAGPDPLLRHVRTRVRSPQTKRCDRKMVRHLEIRAPVPWRDHRRRRAGHGGPPIPGHLQHDQAAPGTRRSNT